MGKKQKMKKAAQLAANVSAAAATLQKGIDAGKGGAGAEAEGAPGVSPTMLDPAYRKNLKKLMNLAEKLPSNLLAQQMASKVKETNEKAHSTDDGESTDSDDEAPELVNTDSSKFCDLSSQGQMGLMSSDDYPRHSRGEKKARRLLMKLDLKPIENVSRVTMKKNKNIMLFIEKPEVYKCAPDTYIIFGKVLVEDLTNAAATQAAERYREVEANRDRGAAADAGGTAQVEDEDGEDVDEAAAKDLDEKDIELVQMQASCSRSKAIKALLQNGHDVVNAIMDLTMG